MNVKLSKENSDFIKATYGCKDVGAEEYDSIYFQPNVFIQTRANKGTDIFEEKHLSDLSKEDLLGILDYMIINRFPPLNK